MQPQLILAHGAGAGSNSDFMQSLAKALQAQQIKVRLFDFRYRQQAEAAGKPRPPSKMAVLEAEMLAQLPKDQTEPCFIGGKSMGGRVAARILENCPARAAFVFGFPYHPAGKPQNHRRDDLGLADKPIHIFQGERDPLGNYTALAQANLPSHVHLHSVASGDHDFKPTKASGLTQQELIATVAAQVAERIQEY